VDADLMCSTGLNIHLDSGALAPPFKDANFADSTLPFRDNAQLLG
jgi:hypothetical protein